MPLHQQRFIGFLSRMVQAADAAQLDRVQWLPLDGSRRQRSRPGIQFILPLRSLGPNSVFCRANLFLNLDGLPQLVVGVNPRLSFVGVIQKREQPVVLVLSDRVKLMRMTLSTLS